MSEQYDKPVNSDTPYPEAEPANVSSGYSQYPNGTNNDPQYNQHPSQYAQPQAQYPNASYPPHGYGKSPDQEKGEKLAQTSMILGIISIFFAGIILGPMAIYKASQAQQLNADATVGKVTGWIGSILAGFSLLWIFFMIFIVVVSGSGGY